MVTVDFNGTKYTITQTIQARIERLLRANNKAEAKPITGLKSDAKAKDRAGGTPNPPKQPGRGESGGVHQGMVGSKDLAG